MRRDEEGGLDAGEGQHGTASSGAASAVRDLAAQHADRTLGAKRGGGAQLWTAP